MKVTCGTAECDACVVCKQELADQKLPVSPLRVLMVVFGAVMLCYFSTVFVGQGKTWIDDGKTAIGFVGYATWGIGWLVRLGTGIACIVAFCRYFARNVFGTSYIYIVGRTGSFHVHNDEVHKDAISGEATRVVVRGRVGGWFRDTTVAEYPGINSKGWRSARTWNGTHMTIVDRTLTGSSGEVTLPIVDAMRFLVVGEAIHVVVTNAYTVTEARRREERTA